jgi:hypothetical protein
MILSAILFLAMTINIPEPVNPQHGISVSSDYIKDFITEHINDYGNLSNDIKLNDNEYILYPYQTIVNAVKSIPDYNDYRYHGNINYDYIDCDDRAQWSITFLRLMLPGCAAFYIIGYNDTHNVAHAFVGIVTSGGNILWTNGSPDKWEIFWGITLNYK